MFISTSLLWKITIVFFCYILLQGNTIEAYSDKNECLLCTSKDCISHARGIIRNMKTDVDPCEDFYSFACGSYIEKFSKDDTRSVYDDTWHSLQVLASDMIRNLQPEEGTVSEKLKIVYDSCMDIESSQLRVVPVAINFLNNVGIPDWPNLESNFQFENLGESLGKLAAYGEFAFLTIMPSPYEDKESNLYSASSAIILPGNYLLSSKIKPKELEGSVIRILKYFNVNESESQHIWSSFKDIENLGITLQNQSSGSNMHCKGIQRTYATVNCSYVMEDSMKLLCKIWKSAVEFGHFKNYYSEDAVHVSCHWNHFHLIKNVFTQLLNTVDHRSLANYLSLRFYLSHLDDMNLYFHLTPRTHPNNKDSKSQIPEPIARWKYCTAWIIKSMPMALGFEYVQNILSEPIQNNVLDMIENYLQVLIHKIENQDWIEESLSVFLKKQLKKLNIGFKTTMERFRNQSAVFNYYKEFVPTKESFLENVLRYEKASVIRKDKASFNSFYTSSDSYTMDFGVALLLPPTYSYGLPQFLKYSTLGPIIGHELSHNMLFFLDLDDGELGERIKCFINQYSQFTIAKTGKGFTSNEAKEEIIADSIGWELTRKIFQDRSDLSEEFYLPGLNYTASQLMFIAFVQDSCATLSEKVEKEFYQTKSHHLHKLRIKGILQNSKPFSEAFNCDAWTVMNPENKCTLLV